MRVRNLRQYIESIPGSGYDIKELGTHREPFLTYMGGHYQSVEQVKKFIESSSSFATNAEEQLFYEFVQNAYDAQADSLFFFANDEYLIVLNNGKPFYTDFDLQADDKKSGQLFNFLAKGKSDKPGDDEQMGQYGQGSKLLYTLITNVPETGEYTDAELLVDAIYNKRKGPYLISWNSQEQLNNLLLGEKKWELAQADDYENNILFAKILYSYFPIAPGQEPSLFSDSEAKKVVEVFDSLVDPRRNLQFLNSGTALVVPLGKGKAALINSSSNLSKVRTRLGGFSALTADQEGRKVKKLQHIYVLKQEIEQTEVKSITWEKKQGAKTYKYHLAFNPKFAQEGYVNIFKGLPILSTKHHLGFIIDSQCFQTDDSRQRLSNPETSGKQINDIFEELIKRLQVIKTSDPDTFDWIYNSLMASQIAHNEDSAFLLHPFNEVIKPFLECNVRTNTGTYCNASQVYASSVKYSFDIPLAELGVVSKNWVDPSIVKSLKYIGIHIGSLELSNIISDANAVSFQNWVKGLSDEDYKAYQDVCWNYIQNRIHTGARIFRSDKKNLYSYDNLVSDSPIYYGYEQRLFNGLEHIPVPFTGTPSSEYFNILLNKIKKNLDSYRSSSVLKDTICHLLTYIVTNHSYLKSDIVNNIYLFENQLGNRCSFSQLFANVPDGSKLFDEFKVKGYLPDCIKSSGWMIDAKKAPKTAWNWVVSNIDQIIKVSEWEDYAHDYLSDIRKLYKSLPEAPDTLITNLYIDESGKPTKNVHALVKSRKNFSEEDYSQIQSIFSNESLLPLDFYKDLSDKPFDLTKVSFKDLIDDGLTVNIDELATLTRYIPDFLDSFWLKQVGHRFTLNSLGIDGKNYTNELDSNLSSILDYNHFYFVPNDAQRIFDSKTLGDYDISNNASLMNDLVLNSEASTLLSILPLVEKSNDNILSAYFQRLTIINIDSKLSDSDYQWRIIKLAANRNGVNNYKSIIFDKIRHKNTKLADTIVEEYVKVEDREYELYLLDSNYKVSNGHISSFMKCLPSPNDEEYFKKQYYKGKLTGVDASTVYKNIYSNALSLMQLQFCLDYAFTNKLTGVRFKSDPAVSITKVMDMVEANNMVGFDKYYTLQNFNVAQQVYADSSLLLTKEHLPADLTRWLDSHNDSLKWFSTIRTSNETLIAVRESVRDNKEYTGLMTEFSIDSSKLHDTVDWILSKKIVCASNTFQYKVLSEIIKKLPETFSGMPFFKFTGDTLIDSNDKNVYALLSFCLYTNGCPFLNVNERAFAETLSVDHRLKQFIQQSNVYENPGSGILRKHRVHTSPMWEVKSGISKGSYDELNYIKYKEWKQTKESDGITLWTSKSPVGVTLAITDSNNKELYSIKRANAEYGYSYRTKQVVVQWPNKEQLSKIDTISKFSKNIFWLKDPLIAFLKMYVNETDVLQQIAEDNGIEMQDIVDMVKNTLAGNKVDATTMSAVQKSPEVFKTMVSNMDEATLKKVSENASLLQSLLKQYSQNELKNIAGLSKSTLDVLTKYTKEELEAILNNAPQLANGTPTSNVGIDPNIATIMQGFVAGLGCDNDDQLNQKLNSIKNAYDHFDQTGWDKFTKNAGKIAQIVEKFDEEQIQQIADNKENLQEFLDEMKKDKQEQRDSSISEIIGYLGELIYEQYLLKKGIKYEFSADQGIGEYDFVVYPPSSTKERYVDVKTTRNTLSDGRSPMYIHKKQDEFLRANIGVAYRFVRISLHDLEDELETEYDNFRQKYGNIDPRKNPDLKKDCQDLAKRYWSQADINDFQDQSPEYKIEFINL